VETTRRLGTGIATRAFSVLCAGRPVLSLQRQLGHIPEHMKEDDGESSAFDNLTHVKPHEVCCSARAAARKTLRVTDILVASDFVVNKLHSKSSAHGALQRGCDQVQGYKLPSDRDTFRTTWLQSKHSFHA